MKRLISVVAVMLSTTGISAASAGSAIADPAARQAARCDSLTLKSALTANGCTAAQRGAALRSGYVRKLAKTGPQHLEPWRATSRIRASRPQ